MGREPEVTPFEEALLETGNGVYNMALVAVCAFTLLAIGVGMFGFTLVVVAACDLGLTISQKGILTSLPFVGIFLVSFVWGYIADTKGRKFTLLLSMQAGFVLAAASSLSPNWIVLGVIQFLSVCFSCASNSATYTIVGESCNSLVRGRYMLLMTSMLLLSPATAALLTYPTLKLNFSSYIPVLDIYFKPWRLLCLVLAIPSGISSVALHFMHESPKFLVNSGRHDEALEVLRKIHASNCADSVYKVKAIKLEEGESIQARKGNIFITMYERSAPLFRPPYLKRTLHLFFIISVIYIINNSFLVWLPHVMKILSTSPANATGSICDLLTKQPPAQVPIVDGLNMTEVPITECVGEVEDLTIWTLAATAAIFSFLNFLISHLPHRRKAVLITTLSLSCCSGLLLNLVSVPVLSVFFFMVFTITCLGMGILASYFVELYPTSYRGMIACLSVMVARTSTFAGINIVGAVLFDHCVVSFYAWSLLVFFAVIAACFLPPDKRPLETSSSMKS